jgi:hypothetical protein
MMLRSVTTKLKLSWDVSSGDTSQCTVCKDPIFGNMYTMAFSVISRSGKKKTQTELRLCESCHSMKDA